MYVIIRLQHLLLSDIFFVLQGHLGHTEPSNPTRLVPKHILNYLN